MSEIHNLEPKFKRGPYKKKNLSVNLVRGEEQKEAPLPKEVQLEDPKIIITKNEIITKQTREESVLREEEQKITDHSTDEERSPVLNGLITTDKLLKVGSYLIGGAILYFTLFPNTKSKTPPVPVEAKDSTLDAVEKKPPATSYPLRVSYIEQPKHCF